MKAFLIFQKLLLVNLLFLISIDSGYCGDYTWRASPSDNNWDNYSNWTPLPTAAFSSTDNITIVSSSIAPVINSNQTIGKLTITSGSLTINSGITLDVSGATIIASGTTIYGAGQLNIGSTTSSVTSIAIGGSGSTTIHCSIYGNTALLSLKNSTFQSGASFKAAATASGQGGNTFNGAVSIESNGSAGIKFGESAGDTYNGNITLISSQGLITMSSSVYTSNYNGNIVVKSTGSGISFGTTGQNPGSSVLDTGKTISAQDFTAGTLTLRNFLQQDTTKQGIMLETTTTGVINFSAGTQFKGKLDVTAPEVILSGGTFYDSCTFTKTGSMPTSSSGTVLFKGDVVFNSNSGIWYICYNNPSNYVFEGNATFNKNSANLFSIAHNTNALAQFTKTDKTIIINNGGGSGSIAIAANGAIESSGKMIFQSNSAGTIAFGGTAGLSTFNDGAELQIDSINFTSGGVNFKGVSQIGNKKQTLISNAGSVTFNVNCTFDGIVKTRFPNINFNGTVFKDSVIAIKTGGSTTCTGGNIFWGPVVLTSAGNNFWYLGNVNPDIFYENISCYRQTNFVVDLARTATSEIYKNVSFYNSSTGDPTIGTNGGKLAFKGSASQVLSYDKATFLVVNNIILDKSSNHVTLNANIQVNTSIQFIKGNLITSSSKLIKINTTNVTGASALSFIDGPVQKVGNTAFAFPVGKKNDYRPIETFNFSGGTTATVVQAEYFDTPSSVATIATIDKNISVSSCEYWSLINLSTSSLTSQIRLHWPLTSCMSGNNPKLVRSTSNQWGALATSLNTGVFPKLVYTTSTVSIAGSSTGLYSYGFIGVEINTENVNAAFFDVYHNTNLVFSDKKSGKEGDNKGRLFIETGIPASSDAIEIKVKENNLSEALQIQLNLDPNLTITNVKAKIGTNAPELMSTDFYSLPTDIYHKGISFRNAGPDISSLDIRTNLSFGALEGDEFEIEGLKYLTAELKVYSLGGAAPIATLNNTTNKVDKITWDTIPSEGLYKFILKVTDSSLPSPKVAYYEGQFIKK